MLVLDLVTGINTLLASFLLMGHNIIQGLNNFNILLIESAVQFEISVAGKEKQIKYIT